MKNEKTIDVLNTIIEINNDRIEGYETALKETEEAEFKSLFAQFAYTSQKCNSQLIDEVQKLGGTPAEGTKVSGKFYAILTASMAIERGLLVVCSRRPKQKAGQTPLRVASM